MSTRVENASWAPAYGWWVMVAIVLTAGLVSNWFIAAGVMAFLLLNAARPFDFFTAFMVVVAGSAFVYHEGGELTYQLGLLCGAGLLMLYCYFMTTRGEMFAIAWTNITKPLVLYVALSFVNLVRGYAAGYPFKHVTIELVGVMALACTILVANTFDLRRYVGVITGVLVATAYGSAALGFYIFSVLHVRTAGVYFTGFPGMVALFLINRSLRSPTLKEGLGWMVVSAPLWLHQFLSYRRALWLGCLAGIIVTVITYARFGKGRRPYWRRVGTVFGALLALSLIGAVAMAVFYHQTDILEQAGGRFASITTTKFKGHSRGVIDPGVLSNAERLIEYPVMAGFILQNPVLGYGLGFTYLVTKPFLGPHAQWWSHQNYLHIWLKQGAIGLGLFLWLLWSAFTLGLREARRRTDPWEATWFASAATCTLFVAVFSMTDVPFTQVNCTFLLALLWGGEVAMTHKGLVRLQW
jgi:hypothetical protein